MGSQELGRTSADLKAGQVFRGVRMAALQQPAEGSVRARCASFTGGPRPAVTAAAEPYSKCFAWPQACAIGTRLWRATKMPRLSSYGMQ
jgi:hypothetical protein